MPNPVVDNVQFDFIGIDETAELKVEIADVNGRIVLSRNYTPNGSRLTENINTEALLPGVYFVLFNNGNIR
jgi:hypothetical protein